MEYSTLLYEVVDGVALIRLNRPERMNAIGGSMKADLSHALFERARCDDAVRCVVITGAGDSAFCAGADIKERAARHGRAVAVWAQTGMLCGETEADAKKRYHYFVNERGDREAVENQMRMLMGGGGQTLDFRVDDAMLERMIAMQHATQLIGSPEQIVDKMEELSSAGLDGITVIWMDYERGIEEFRELVLPLAIDAGLRER